jgi:DNA-binding transcriptional LysR family regulator
MPDNCHLGKKPLHFGMDFDRRQLSAFLAIATHGSLGRAAEVLHVTQPALSRIVKRLEDQIGAALFERNSKGMLLTPVGATLLPHAALMARVAETASEEIRALRGLARGTIKVGGIASAVSLILPQALQRVLTRWPNLQAQITEGVWDRLADALARHEIDIALGEATGESEAVVQIADCTWQDQSYIVAARGHPLQREDVRLEDSLQYRWACTPRGTAPYRHMQRTFLAHGLPCPELAVETRSIMVMKSLMTHADFLCWMAGPMFESERGAGLLAALPLPDLGSTRTLAAFRRRDGILPAPAVKLLDELRAIASSDPVAA